MMMILEEIYNNFELDKLPQNKKIYKTNILIIKPVINKAHN